jgi:hypothetical protein
MLSGWPRSQNRDLGHPLKVWRLQLDFRQRNHGPLDPPKVIIYIFTPGTFGDGLLDAQKKIRTKTNHQHTPGRKGTATGSKSSPAPRAPTRRSRGRNLANHRSSIRHHLPQPANIPDGSFLPRNAKTHRPADGSRQAHRRKILLRPRKPRTLSWRSPRAQPAQLSSR